MNANRMTLSKWYGSSVSIPSSYDHRFVMFTVGCMGIVRSLVQQVMEKEVSVRFARIPTAAADIKRGLININEDFLKGKFKEGRLEEVSTTVSVLMGLIVHEAAHFAYSPADLTPWSKHIKAHLPSDIPYSENVAMTLGNIVEDIFIEAEVGRRVPLIAWTLEYLNEIFFTTEDYDKAYQAVQGIDEPPQKGEQVGSVLNYLIYAKIADEPEATAYVNELFSLALSARKLDKLQDRLDLALGIYLKLMQRITDKELKGLPDLSYLPEGVGEASKSIGEVLDEIYSKSLGGGADHAGKAEPAAGVSPNSVAGETNDRLKDTEKERLRLSFDEPGESSTTVVYREVAVEPRASACTIDARYLRLAEIARQRASANRPYGQDKNRGHNIRKLYRIATDQRIFAEQVRVSSYEPMQVMVFVDCSGSMCSFIDGTFQPKITAAFEAAVGAVTALNDGRCSVALYGHTADSDSLYQSTVIYRLKSFTDPMNHLAEKASSVLPFYDTCNNRDGDAILYVSKLFTHQFKRKLLIVISDGQPAAMNYAGKEAINATKQVVDGIRHKGIDVLSISIEEGAREINDRIYGKENNVYNQDPNVIENVVKYLMTG